MKKKFLLFAIMVYSISGFSQLSDSIVGMTETNHVYSFCKIDIASGNVTSLGVIATNPSTMSSSCIDNNRKLYYFCDGTSIIEINPSTGVINSTTPLSLASGMQFENIRFNPCDSTIYGFLRENSSWKFAKYVPLTGVFSIISSVNPTITPPMGATGFIDSENSLYYSNTGHGVTATDLATGNLKFSSVYLLPSGENFGHLAFNSATREIFGISTSIQSISSGSAYLSTVDPHSGQVTHVTSTGWPIGYWTPMNGGQCINQSNGDYYYATNCGATLIEAYTSNGNVRNSFLNSNNICFVEHFSSGECALSISNTVTEAENLSDVYCNYSFGELHVNANNSILNIYDVSGKVILEKKINDRELIEINNFHSGIYFYKLTGISGIEKSGKFIK